MEQVVCYASGYDVGVDCYLQQFTRLNSGPVCDVQVPGE